MNYLKNNFPISYFYMSVQSLHEIQMNFLQISCATTFGNKPRNKIRDKVVYTGYFFFVCWSLLTGLNIFGRLTGVSDFPNYSMQHKIIDTCWLALYGASMLFRTEYLRKSKEAEKLIKETYMLHTVAERNGIGQSYADNKEDIILPIAYIMGTVSLYFFPSAAFLLTIFKPCTYILLSSLYLPCVEGELHDQPDSKSLLWGSGTGRIIFSAIESVFMLQLTELGELGDNTGYLHFLVIIKKVLKNDCRYQKNISVIKWRYYQNLVQLFNDCNSSVLSPLLITGWTIITITAAYACIKLWGILPIPMYTLMAMLAFDGLVFINFLATYAGYCNENSKKLLSCWRKSLLNQNEKKQSDSRVLLNSFQPLKIKLGQVNYFDMTTSLVSIDLVVDQLVTLLLTT